MAAEPRGRGWGSLAAAAIVGALAGTALTYGLATLVPLPGPQAPDLGPQLAALEQRLGAMEESAAGAGAALDTASAETAARLTTLEAAVAEVRTAIPAPADTGALETRVRALASRVDAIAAGASSADAGAIAENIADLEASLASLRSEVQALSGRSGAAETTLATLSQEVSALKTAAAEAAVAEAERAVSAPSATLPLIASGLETAFATGRPFATELASLATADAAIAVDERVALRAGTGLPRPDVLDREFAEAVPAMLAARPRSGTDVQQSAGDWLASLFAVRPAGEVEGDSPEAVISRLEGSMSRHDYAGATALFAMLPPEMAAAAGAVPADIAVHAAAAALVAELKGKAAAP